ncbi:acyl carrier protein [Lentzea xinjiangensis]|uniref:Acyl carrier protein n=1 Tax=Lentzea xinjiangensis TaxID=402600 RepID=A0A1H9T0F0_9PSEU|nr:acyl carrier protein [Lentzea xinjiangensis]SER90103.1 acyl carrier protein [Lentzea xinjiangensis]
MEIIHTIKEVLASEVFVEVPKDQMNPDDSLRDAYGLDSLGFAELRVQCEDRFGITIPDDEFNPENFGTIASVVALVERRVSARQDLAKSAEKR